MRYGIQDDRLPKRAGTDANANANANALRTRAASRKPQVPSRRESDCRFPVRTVYGDSGRVSGPSRVIVSSRS